jgi:hypothetical protein
VSLIVEFGGTGVAGGLSYAEALRGLQHIGEVQRSAIRCCAIASSYDRRGGQSPSMLSTEMIWASAAELRRQAQLAVDLGCGTDN